MPVFVVAPVMVLVFAVMLKWLPASYSSASGGGRLIMPVIALALPQIAYIARLTRASMINMMSSDFVRTARAQGLSTSCDQTRTTAPRASAMRLRRSFVHSR